MGFPHLHYPSNKAFAKRVVEKAEACGRRYDVGRKLINMGSPGKSLSLFKRNDIAPGYKTCYKF